MGKDEEIDPKMLDNLDLLMNMEVLEAEDEWEIIAGSEESEDSDE